MGVGETATFYLQTNRVLLHIISWRLVPRICYVDQCRPSFWPLPLLGRCPKHMM